MPMGDFGSKHIYLISDLKNDLFNDIGLFICISFIQKLCSFNYFRARCGYNKGNHLNIIPIKQL